MGRRRSHVSEMHGSLFAVGDCFGVAGADERGKKRAERLRPILTQLANAEGDRARSPGARPGQLRTC